MQLVDEIALDPTLVINFPDPDELIPPMYYFSTFNYNFQSLQFWDVTFRYANGEPLFEKLNLGIDMESRIALVLIHFIFS